MLKLNSQLLKVTKAGISCVKIGNTSNGKIVIQQSGYAYQGKWNLGYSVDGQSYSGSVEFDLTMYGGSRSNENKLSLINYTNLAKACGSPHLCDSITQDFDDSNPIYIIFSANSPAFKSNNKDVVK